MANPLMPATYTPIASDPVARRRYNPKRTGYAAGGSVDDKSNVDPMGFVPMQQDFIPPLPPPQQRFDPLNTIGREDPQVNPMVVGYDTGYAAGGPVAPGRTASGARVGEVPQLDTFKPDNTQMMADMATLRARTVNPPPLVLPTPAALPTGGGAPAASPTTYNWNPAGAGSYFKSQTGSDPAMDVLSDNYMRSQFGYAQGGEVQPDDQAAPPPDFEGYMQGSNALPPEELNAILQQIAQLDPNKDEDAVNLTAIIQAAQSGDMERASSILAGFRKRFDSLNAMAQGAAAHGDMAAAAKIASKAHSQVPDGKTVRYDLAGADGSVVATIMPGGQSFQMNPQQFHDYLVGPGTSFDHILENGIEKNLTIASRQGGAPAAVPAVPAAPAAPAEPTGYALGGEVTDDRQQDSGIAAQQAQQEAIIRQQQEEEQARQAQTQQTAESQRGRVTEDTPMPREIIVERTVGEPLEWKNLSHSDYPQRFVDERDYHAYREQGHPVVRKADYDRLGLESGGQQVVNDVLNHTREQYGIRDTAPSREDVASETAGLGLGGDRTQPLTGYEPQVAGQYFGSEIYNPLAGGGGGRRRARGGGGGGGGDGSERAMPDIGDIDPVGKQFRRPGEVQERDPITQPRPATGSVQRVDTEGRPIGTPSEPQPAEVPPAPRVDTEGRPIGGPKPEDTRTQLEREQDVYDARQERGRPAREQQMRDIEAERVRQVAKGIIQPGQPLINPYDEQIARRFPMGPSDPITPLWGSADNPLPGRVDRGKNAYNALDRARHAWDQKYVRGVSEADQTLSNRGRSTFVNPNPRDPGGGAGDIVPSDRYGQSRDEQFQQGLRPATRDVAQPKGTFNQQDNVRESQDRFGNIPGSPNYRGPLPNQSIEQSPRLAPPDASGRREVLRPDSGPLERLQPRPVAPADQAAPATTQTEAAQSQQPTVPRPQQPTAQQPYQPQPVTRLRGGVSNIQPRADDNSPAAQAQRMFPSAAQSGARGDYERVRTRQAETDQLARETLTTKDTPATRMEREQLKETGRNARSDGRLNQQQYRTDTMKLMQDERLFQHAQETLVRQGMMGAAELLKDYRAKVLMNPKYVANDQEEGAMLHVQKMLGAGAGATPALTKPAGAPASPAAPAAAPAAAPKPEWGKEGSVFSPKGTSRPGHRWSNQGGGGWVVDRQ